MIYGKEQNCTVIMSLEVTDAPQSTEKTQGVIRVTTKVSTCRTKSLPFGNPGEKNQAQLVSAECHLLYAN